MSSFSLKHRLLSDEVIATKADVIKQYNPDFDAKSWYRESIDAREKSTLLETLETMARLLHTHLPTGSRKSQLPNLLKSLPPPLDGEKSDGEFGEFIQALYGYFVVDLLTQDRSHDTLCLSYQALEEITKRFSMEFAYRAFLSLYKQSSLEKAQEWMKNPHAHIRRLASEGTRPSLPWGKKYSYEIGDTDIILLHLWKDPCDHVARSVANHLNDITKISRNHAFKILGEIPKIDQKTHEKRWQYLLSHGLRNLIKANDNEALKLLGYYENTGSLSVSIDTQKIIRLGDTIVFEWHLSTESDEVCDVIIECLWRFPGKKDMRSKKLRISRASISKEKPLSKKYQLPLISRSTRLLLPGVYSWTWYINGKESTYLEREVLPPL